MQVLMTTQMMTQMTNKACMFCDGKPRKIFFCILAVITLLLILLPSPRFQKQVSASIRFDHEASLLSVLNQSSISYVRNQKGYFFFNDRSHFLRFPKLSIKSGQYVLLRYAAYPQNRRGIQTSPIASVRFETDGNPDGARLEGLSSTFRPKWKFIRIPDGKNLSFRLTSTIGNVVDDTTLVLEEVAVLKNLPFYLKIWFSLYNLKVWFLGIFGLLLCLKLFSSRKKKTILFFALLLVLNSFQALPFEKKSPLYSDAIQYSAWGKTMLENHVIGPDKGRSSAHWPPLWPFVLGIMQSFYPDMHTLILFMFFMRFLICLLIFQLVLRYLAQPVAFAATLLFFFYPQSVLMARVFYSEMLYLVCMLSFLWFYLKLRDHDSWKNQVITALFFLLALHTKQEILIFFLMLLGLDVLLKKMKLKTAIILCSLMICGVLPYTIRNAVTMGKPILVSSTFGQNLFMGNNPQYLNLGTGPYNNPFVSVDAALNDEQRAYLATCASEVESGAMLSCFAKDYIFGEMRIPVYLKQKLRLYFFWEGYPWSFSLAGLHIWPIPFWFIWLCGLFGCIIMTRDARASVLRNPVIAAFCSNFAIAIIFFLRGERHRLLLMPILVIGLGYLLYFAWRQFEKCIMKRNSTPI